MAISLNNMRWNIHFTDNNTFPLMSALVSAASNKAIEIFKNALDLT